MKKSIWLAIASALVLFLLTSCWGPRAKLPVDPYSPEPGNSPSSTAPPNPTLVTPSTYLTQISFDPTSAQYFREVSNILSLTDPELKLLKQNGFVATDRLAWDRFMDAYAWIYWKDLPVLVTTDSILHAVHQSYDDMLIDVERMVIMPALQTMLERTSDQIRRAQAANASPELAPLYNDVAVYVDVALALLKGQPQVDEARLKLYGLAHDAKAREFIDLFGTRREIDFSLFQPRGHYANEADLQQYFRAMSWLAQIDFRFIEFDPFTSQPILRPGQIAAASILKEAIDGGGERQTWQEIDQLLEALVGESDNVTLPDFDRLLTDSGLNTPEDALRVDPKHLLNQIMRKDYGYQRITGQLLARAPQNLSPAPVPRPVSFMLMGQRFAIDSYVMGNLVYDRMIKDGKPILRALPSPLDVMYALGNNRAQVHLKDELATYNYASHLAEMRSEVDQLPSDYWKAPVYNQWLRMLRSLNDPTVAKEYPQALRTEAWADKTLQTQLASWAQLRHDNILYVKQSTTMMVACSYPKGYVEPYPAFYAALYEYAQSTYNALKSANVSISQGWLSHYKSKALDYLSNIMQAAEQLKKLAEKELKLEPFTAEEENFLKSVVVRQDNPNRGCAPTFIWDGWYADMFYSKDDNPALIADVHTNPNDDGPLAPVRVLHVGTGQAVPLVLVAETDEGATAYVGPSFTYYETIETGNPPVRLTDKYWQSRFTSDSPPAHPDWTESFLVSMGKPAGMMRMLAQ